MKKAIAVTAALLTIGTVAAAEPIITTGGKSGTYIRVGHNIKKMMGGKVITSRGGEQNVQRVMSGEAQVGMCQMDTYGYMSSKNPEMLSSIEVIGPLYEEAVYLVGNCKGRVTDEDHLQSKGKTIAIGKKGAGSISTWNYMGALEPGYKEANTVMKGGVRALAALAADAKGDIDAVLFVGKPSVDDKLVKVVMKSKDLCFIDVDDKDLNDVYKPTNKPIYRNCKVDVASGVFNDTEVHTICMDAVVIANTDTDEEYLDSLAVGMLTNKELLLK